MSRVHVVLIPGFAGFDILGQLEYYAGITPLFRQWQSGRANHPETVLHYFDNFPTAGVSTRAGRLNRYLVKRIARGEFQTGDSVALVGHSTGGLDIRRLLLDLATEGQSIQPVDGTTDIRAGDLLDLIKRVVFLSVPQWGTNIAHWVRTNIIGRAAIVAELRAAIALTQAPVLGRIQEWVSQCAAGALNLDLLRAIDDTLREAEAPANGDCTAMANAHEAAAELDLWLRHIVWDFGAIDDLAPCNHLLPHPAFTSPEAKRLSPAAFNLEERSIETDVWRQHEISTRSYATVSTRPFNFQSGQPAPVWHLIWPWTWPDLTARADETTNTDLIYRYCYRACAGGPFRLPTADIPSPKLVYGSAPRKLELWDNDGIVNTASMLWPSGEDTRLVTCDHEDIAGHFELVDGSAALGRSYRAYDLLGSGSGFGQSRFADIWYDIFGFCSGAGTAAAPAGAAAA